ncbi:MAG: DUF1926 domain-containing protein, partial [Oligoflexia bacterium]|nr:DUF1926 domain-containing protein [Oligoflexia bacterium]
PRGMWLAERVWEPSMPVILAKAGVDYVVLDDEHFFSAGLDKKSPLTGYYNTERQGYSVSVFPSDMGLRYKIPFHEVDKCIEYLNGVSKDSESDVCITYGDDGEKFGVWPGTFRWVIEEKWLEKFFTALEKNQKTILTTTLAEIYGSLDPEGLIYLPTASYSEMLEWAMPADSIIEYDKLKHHVRDNAEIKDLLRFVKGGFWDNFLVKYPESNLVHKRTISVSQKLSASLDRIPSAKAELIRSHLYKAQCNCAYWHGLFGGVYLNHLRHALFENLIIAEKILDEELKLKPGLESLDYDYDGNDEFVYSNPVYSAFIDPDFGGAVTEIDYKAANINVVNTLGRKKEAYHGKIKKLSEKPKDPPDTAVSIHDMDLYIPDEAFEGFAYDKYRRLTFIDHIVPVDTSLDDLRLQKFDTLGTNSLGGYKVVEAGENILRLTRSRKLKLMGQDIPVRVDKIYEFNNTNFNVNVGVLNESEEYEIEFMLLVEANINLLAGNDPSRYVLIDGVKADPSHISVAASQQCEKVTLVDEAFGFSVHYSLDRAGKLFRYPVETISAGEHGGEKVFQGTSLVFGVPFVLSPQEGKDVNLNLAFTGRSR